MTNFIIFINVAVLSGILISYAAFYVDTLINSEDTVSPLIMIIALLLWINVILFAVKFLFGEPHGL